MRRAVWPLLLILAGGCSSAPATEPETVPAPQPAPPPTDPRVSELQILVHELLDRIEVMNARLQSIESGTAAPVTSTRRTGQPAATPVPTPRPVASATPAPAATPRPARPSVTPSRSTVTAAAGDRYKEGLVLFGKGQINEARRVFEEVLATDPAGELADNAIFWVAETYYVTGKFTEALSFYRRVESEFPDGNKSPDAVLKIGMVQAKQGDLALARRTLEALVAKYPYSTAANAAKAELKRIQY